MHVYVLILTLANMKGDGDGCYNDRLAECGQDFPAPSIIGKTPHSPGDIPCLTEANVTSVNRAENSRSSKRRTFPVMMAPYSILIFLSGVNDVDAHPGTRFIIP